VPDLESCCVFARLKTSGFTSAFADTVRSRTLVRRLTHRALRQAMGLGPFASTAEFDVTVAAARVP
jgi:hypothetical protein